ncbi:protein QUIRKY-like [Gossypium australe]|uniref:Protein QUIRKY-like n=1 Tax=Gossypium australe TaxID=47621 RepID=A0A5B6WJH1_9ROSI|nr:protein QUIRKY-like [Gossypium australe]
MVVKCDAYCVAKNGPKWVKTRTVVDSFNPKWNKQHSWDVYDLYTVLTIRVFDYCLLRGGDAVGDGKDTSLRKVQIRLYTYSYPFFCVAT